MQDDNFVSVMIAGALLFTTLLFFIVVYILLYTRRQKINNAERTRLIFEYEQQVLQARLDEHERAVNQISRELHDNVAQQVDFLHMNLKALQEEDRTRGEDRYITNCNAIVQRVANDLRNISYSLNSSYIRAKGLGEVLRQELDYLSAARELHCAMEIEGIYRTMPAETELIIYRIAQEALHNTLKHAGAANIRVLLRYDTDGFEMTVEDDGCGFEPAQKRGSSSLGLHNMQQRALLLHASLTLDSAPGNGCRLQLRLQGAPARPAAVPRQPQERI